MSHHQNDPTKIEKLAKINAYHTTLFAYYLEKLHATPTATARCSITCCCSTGRACPTATRTRPTTCRSWWWAAAPGRCRAGVTQAPERTAGQSAPDPAGQARRADRQDRGQRRTVGARVGRTFGRFSWFSHPEAGLKARTTYVSHSSTPSPPSSPPTLPPPSPRPGRKHSGRSAGQDANRQTNCKIRFHVTSAPELKCLRARCWSC